MAKAMTVKPACSLQQARTASIVASICALAALLPAGAQAAGATTDKALGITIPASAKVHSTDTTTTPPATTAPTASVPPSTTPPSATTSPSAPTGAAQPGTVAPPTTTPAGATTQTASTPTSAPPATTTSGSTTVIVAHKQKPSAKGLSAGALALAILGALLVLGCIVWALGRWLALEPRWAISLTHSLREASYRASETWAEFGDWARLGR
jgi:hypothetical protein